MITLRQLSGGLTTAPVADMQPAQVELDHEKFDESHANGV
jgi:hypothetical protein